MNRTADHQFVALSIAQAGKITPVEIKPGGPALFVQNECYLASKGGVTHQRMMLQSAPQSEQLPMQRVCAAAADGGGTVFLQAGGITVVKQLREREAIFAHTACIAAVTEGVTVHPPVRGAPLVVAGAHYVNYGPVPLGPGWASKAHTACILRGPGTVYLSNLPAPRLARHLVTARGGAADALPVVKLARVFLFLSILGMLGALTQVVTLEHYEF